MFKLLIILGLLSTVSATFDFNHDGGFHQGGFQQGGFQDEIGFPFLTGEVSSTNSKSVETLGKPSIFHDKAINEVASPVSTGHATSFSSRVDAAGKPITLSTGQSGFSSRENVGSKSITYVPVVPVEPKTVVAPKTIVAAKAILTPVITTKSICIPYSEYVAHHIPLVPGYELKVATGNGLGYGSGYGNGNGYGYGYGYVQGHPYAYGR